MQIGGHLRTILPTLWANVWSPSEPLGTVPWRGSVEDSQHGTLPLGGQYHDLRAADSLVVIVHGLGGSPDSFYTKKAATEAARAGFSSLRLALRGADGLAADIYHAGLTDDLLAAIAAPEFRRYRSVFVLGYSMGGNQTLVLASQTPPPRLAAVAAACAPVDLGASGRHLDESRRFIYRYWILRSLKQHYASVESRRKMALPSSAVKSLGTFREWDAQTVVPRFGFRDVDSYYDFASAKKRLAELTTPSLLVMTEDDPIVAAAACRPVLRDIPEALDLRWLPHGGHLGFPRGLDLGFSPRLGFESQVMAFFARHRNE
ncbi:MAG: alpha/beta fold hydrolase [Planctomycetota bacterium]